MPNQVYTLAKNEENLILKDEVYAIIGAAMAVHSELGPGFLEAVYQEALEIELMEREVPFEAQKLLPVHYRGRTLKKTYQADLVCYDQILVELKAVSRLTEIEEAQLLNYLKVTGLKVGILINFASRTRLEWRRRVL